MMKQVNDFLSKSSRNGLRTLCMAMRVIEEKELKKFQDKVKKVEGALEGKEEKLAELYSEFEKGLCLLGATAVEDML